MNIQNLSFIFLLFIMHSDSLLHAKSAKAPKKPAPTSQDQTLQQSQAQAAAAVFSQNLPTTSINEAYIDAIYGANGLNLAATDLQNIKQTYCYLEFLVRIEKLASNPNPDFQNFLSAQPTTTALMPTQDLVTSAAWTSTTITAQDLADSAMWQTFVKAMVCDSMTNDSQLFMDIAQANGQIFPYIPNIETAYSDNTFENLRFYQESMQLQICMQDMQKQRYLAQCNDWKSITQSNLISGVDQFSKTDFFTYTHNQQPTKQMVIKSPTREQIVCYFMFIQVQSIVFNFMTQTNVQSLLTTTSAAQIAPNFFLYNPSDVIFLDDYFALQQLSDNQKANPSNPSVTMNAAPSVSTPTPTPPAASGTTTSAASTSSDNSTTYSQAEATSKVFKGIPTTSANETIINQIYGSSGLNIAADQLAYIQQTYFYLEFLVKIDKVKNDKKYAKYQKTDFKNFLQPPTDGSALYPTQALATSEGWQAITITDQDIVKSTTWQYYLKAMICDLYDGYTTFMTQSVTANQQILADCPNLDEIYLDPEVIQSRLYLESLQLNATIQAEELQRYLQQCTDWKNIDIQKLDSVITPFKATEFYDITHNAPTQIPDKHSKNKYTAMQADTKNQVLAYYLIITIKTNVDAMMTLQNLSSFLSQASSSKLSPNFFIHIPSDFIYLSDFLTINNLDDQNDTALSAISDTTEDDDSSDNTVAVQSIQDTDDVDSTQAEVVIQKTKSLYGKNKAIDKTNKKDGYDASVKKSNKESHDASRRQAAKTKRMNKNSEKWWKKNKQIMIAVIIAVVVIIAIVAVCILCPEIGIAFAAGFAEGGALGGLMAVGTLAGTAAVAAGTAAAVAATTTITGALIATAVVGATAIAIAGAADPKFGGEVMKATIMPMMIGMEALTNACTTGLIYLAIGCTWFGVGIAEVLGVPGVNPQQSANATKAKMEKYRSTINTVMSVVVTILVTIVIMVISSEAGAMYARMAIAGYFGDAAAASATAAAAASAATAATATSATVVTTTAAKTAAQIAFDNATTIAADQTATASAKAAAQLALKVAAQNLATATAANDAAILAAQQASDLAAQTALQASTRQAAIQASKDLAANPSNVALQAAAQTAADNAATAAQATTKMIADQAAETAQMQATQAATQAATKQTYTVSEQATLAAQSAAKQATTLSESITTSANTIASSVKSAGEYVGNLFSNSAATDSGASITDTGATTTETSTTTSSETTATKTAAQQTTTKTTAQTTTKQATQQSAQKASDNLAAKKAQQKAADEAATKAAQFAKENPSDVAAQTAAKSTQAAADQAATATDLAAKQSTQQTTQLAAQQAAQKLAASPDDPVLQAAAKAAQQNADTASENLLKTTSQKADDNLAAKQAQQKAADEAATKAAQFAKDNPYNGAAQNAVSTTKAAADQAKVATDLAMKQSTQQSAELAAQQAQANANKLAILASENTEDTAAQTAAKAAAQDAATKQTAADAANQALLKTAAKITTDDAARAAGLSSFEIGEEQGQRGVWTAVKNGTLNWGFAIGQALNAGFGVFSALGSVNQDQMAAQAIAQEQQSIQTLWRYVEDNKVNVVQSQNMYLDELNKKHQVAVENQAFGLQYYNNFLNGSVDNVQNQIAQALAQQYTAMLTPDSNGLLVADIGSTWGLQTQFDYLYPAQGFISTTLGRPDFPYAQEVAQAPLASETNGSSTPTDLSDNQPAATKLWFNQRAISVINQAANLPLNVEIKFRVIYSLTTAYHIGLYLGGNYHDYNSAAYLQTLHDQGTIDIDDAHLAKMFVLKRDDQNSPPTLGLYENEGLGWITQQPVAANTLNTSSIYHMSANLNKNQLVITFWSEDAPTKKWTQTVTVTPCDQRTFGVIFSGLAIEWNVVQPTLPIVQNRTARVATNGQSESDREQASKAQWKQILNPKFGSIQMQSAGFAAILQGQYLYTTQDTKLVDSQGNPITDYMVFATATGSTITGIGANPASSTSASSDSAAPSNGSTPPNAIISLISGSVYNASGKVITHQQNALNAYAQVNTSIPLTVGNAISQAAQSYQQQLLQYQFGTLHMTALSKDAINAGLFVYTCPTTLPALNTPVGTPILDASGNAILDYLVMADIVGTSLGSTIGMPPSQAVGGMVSLVTGNVYGRNSTTPIDGGYSEITQYTKNYQLPQAISSAISNAANTYSNITNAQAATQQAAVNVIASQTISLSALLNPAPPSPGGQQIGLTSAAPSNMVTTTSSISQLQTAAAGSSAVQFGGIGAPGFSFGGFNSSLSSTSSTAPADYAMTGGTTLPAQNNSAGALASTTTSQNTATQGVIANPQTTAVQSTNNTTTSSTGSNGTYSLNSQDMGSAVPAAPAPAPAPVFAGIKINLGGLSSSAAASTNTSSSTVNTATTTPTNNAQQNSPPYTTSATTQQAPASTQQTTPIASQPTPAVAAQPAYSAPVTTSAPASAYGTNTTNDFVLAGSSGFSF